MKLQLFTLALDDLDMGQRFYERQQPGLGDYFLDSLFSDIDSLLLYAGIHQRIYGYHRALSKRFPYAIYYKIVEDDIQIWRVLDCRRNPAKTARALKES